MKFKDQIQLAMLRKDRNVSQQEIAQRLGMHQPVISRIETGKEIPSLSFVLRYLDALDYVLEVWEKEEYE